MFVPADGSCGTPKRKAARAEAFENEFSAALLESIPSLRRFARSLTGSADTAEDLVQETMVNAWVAQSRFVEGCSMAAWTHVILRNLFYSRYRRLRYAGPHVDIDTLHGHGVPAGQDSHVLLSDLVRALAQLPKEQREALMMIGAGGLTCEEAAKVCNCPVGTMKSWLRRGRAAVRVLIESGQLGQSRARLPDTLASTFDQIMHEAIALSRPRSD